MLKIWVFWLILVASFAWFSDDRESSVQRRRQPTATSWCHTAGRVVLLEPL